MTIDLATTPVVLEPAAREFADAVTNPPYLYELPLAEGRATFDEVQSGDVAKPDVEVEDIEVLAEPSGLVPVRLVRPPNTEAKKLPVILFIHGAGWVFGSTVTHDRLIRELAVGAGAAVVFPSYSLSPEAKYPAAIEQNYAVAKWIIEDGSTFGFDPSRFAVAGDSVGGNMTAALTLMAKEHGGPSFAHQVLFYPVTDANFDTASYEQFATGYHLRLEAMQWFWDQYTTDPVQRGEITASPLRATTEQLAGLPPATVITGEADVLRDEGEAYANKLRQAGVPVTAVRFQGIIHDFVMLNSLADTNAARGAIALATATLRNALRITD